LKQAIYQQMLLYYITDRTQFSPGDGVDAERIRGSRLLTNIEAACAAGVDIIQLRERDLPARELEGLAGHIVEIASRYSRGTRVLVNSRTDVAISSGAHGVHLRSNDILANDARAVLSKNTGTKFIVSVACHTLREVELAAHYGADFIVFGPVFGKPGIAPAGLEALQAACKAANGIPVLALGGISHENAHQCMEAGASGIAGIRLFQNFPVSETVALLRSA
jgi:thiamine-phosphate pyrophosphorylase